MTTFDDSDTRIDSGQEIVLRALWRQVLSVSTTLGLAVAGAAYLGSIGTGPYSLPPGFSTLVSIAVLVNISVQRKTTTTLTALGLDVRGTTHRRIAWSGIALIRIERRLWTDYVTVYEADGRRTRLRAPTSGPLARDADFPAKYNTIVAWWTYLRGTEA